MANINVRPIAVGAINTNCYVTYDEDTLCGVIIDPGDDAGRIKMLIEDLKIKPEAILLTHGHFDHILACGDLVNLYHIPIYIHEDEKDLIMDAYLNCSQSFSGSGYAIEPSILVKDGQSLDLTGTKINVIHTPGHTKGCCCYYFSDARLLFSGDTLFMESVGRTDLPTGNSSKIISSINEKLFVLDDDVRVFPGHGPSTSIGYEKRNNPYADGLN